MLSKWQILFLMIMTLPIMGHVVILPLMLEVAGRDIFISIILSLPGAFLFIFVIFRLRHHYENRSVNDMFTYLLGKLGGKLLHLIFAIYFMFLTILSFASLVDFVYVGFFPETPIVALIVWFLIFFLYAVIKGFKYIALSSGILALIGIVTGHTITLMDAKYKDWGEMLPLLEFGWVPPILGAIVLTSIWIELLFLLCIPIKNVKERWFFIFLVVGLIINALTMFSTGNGVITIFGLNQAENFNYPAQEIVRIINLGFIDRFDIYGMILMTFGVYIRCALFFRIVYESIVTSNTSKWAKRLTFCLLTIITFIGTLFFAKEHYRVIQLITVYAFMIVLYPIPFVLLFIAMYKKKKSKVYES